VKSPCCASRLVSAGRWKSRCLSCSISYQKPAQRVRLVGGKPVIEEGLCGYRVTWDSRGRPRVFLGVGHRFANTAGWQYLYRWVVMENLDARLRPDEHVHHVDSDTRNCDPSNLEVLSVEFHGRLHGSAVVVAMVRHPDGRFAYLDRSSPIFAWPRFGPVLGPSAADRRFFDRRC
jgi:hypothetical protein